ncbi:MAG TPA: hypothetical protein VIC58_08735 [Actinomycetota bacterium]
MESLAAVLTVLAVVCLWVAAALFGRDTRGAGGWSPASSIRDRSPRLRD